jgi:hypothetical protein
MKWTLVFALADLSVRSVQTFEVQGDPQRAALRLKAEQEWFDQYDVVCAVPGHGLGIRVRDDARTAECELQ